MGQMAMKGLPDSGATDRTENFGFLLLPEFPIYAFILATEALRVANQNAGERLFSSHLISVDGAPVKAGNGMTDRARHGHRRRALPAQRPRLRLQSSDPASDQGPARLAAPPRPPRRADRRRRYGPVRARRGGAARRPFGRAPLGSGVDVPRSLSGHRDPRDAVCHRPQPRDLRRRHRDARHDAASDRRASTAARWPRWSPTVSCTGASATTTTASASPPTTPSASSTTGSPASCRTWRSTWNRRSAPTSLRRAPASRCASSSA